MPVRHSLQTCHRAASRSGQRVLIFIAQGLSDTFDFLLHRQPAARFLGVSPSLVYAYVERKQIPHYRMMGRSIRFRLSELVEWRQQFHVNGGIDEQQDR